MTALDEDVAVELDVDLEKTIPCDFNDECPVPATVRETNRCECRHHLDLCVVHAAEERSFQEDNCKALKCARCDEVLPHPHVNWRTL